MAEACLTFPDLTLGYDRPPAVHDLTGVVGDRERKPEMRPSDALSSVDDAAPRDIEMRRHNVKTLAAAVNNG
ncbi:hypothetical protein V6767_03505 [Martelella sp. FLE1502]